jgi:hypothetical protein
MKSGPLIFVGLVSLTPIPLQAGETVTVTYSSAPAMYYKQL